MRRVMDDPPSDCDLGLEMFTGMVIFFMILGLVFLLVWGTP